MNANMMFLSVPMIHLFHVLLDPFYFILRHTLYLFLEQMVTLMA